MTALLVVTAYGAACFTIGHIVGKSDGYARGYGAALRREWERRGRP